MVGQKFDDFTQGQRDCRDGEPHKEGRGEKYDAGYEFQYEMEAILSERTTSAFEKTV